MVAPVAFAASCIEGTKRALGRPVMNRKQQAPVRGKLARQTERSPLPVYLGNTPAPWAVRPGKRGKRKGLAGSIWRMAAEGLCILRSFRRSQSCLDDGITRHSKGVGAGQNVPCAETAA